MHKIHQYLGIMLTLFMLGSSSGIASLPVADTQDFASDGSEVSLDSGSSDTQSPDNEVGDETPALPPTSDPETDPAAEVVDVADVPEDSGSEANPSTGPPADQPVIDEPVVDEPVIDEPVVDEPVVDEPVVDEPVIDEPVVEEPIVEEPVIEESVVDEPIVEEPAAFETEPVDDVVADNSAATESASTPESEPEISIQAAAVPFTITVINSDQESINGATVVITDYDGDIEFARGTTVNGQITFQLEPGEYFASVTATGYFPQEFYGFFVVEGETNGSDRIMLGRKLDGTFTVNVVDFDTDAPVVGATVAITDDDGVSLATGKTNNAGTYTSTEILPAGQIYFTVSHPNYVSLSVGQWIEGDTTYESLALSPIVGGTITFTAYDSPSDDQTPLANVKVELESWTEPPVTYNGTTSANGKVTFENLPGGEYSVKATLSGYQVREQKLDVHGDANEDLPMFPVNEQPGKLTITTEDMDNNPLNGVLIVVTNENDEVVARGTTSGGTYTTPVLPFGYYDFVATKDGYHEFGPTGIQINGDFAYTANLQKIITGTFTLEVLNSDTDMPVSGAKVTVSHDNLSKDLVLTTNASGIVTFQATSLGAYDIDVTKDGFTTNGGLYTYMGPDKQQIHIRALQPGKAIITVRDADTNKLLPGVKVEIFGGPNDALVFSGNTDANGKIVTGVLPEDGYAAHMTKDGYFAISPTFDIAGDNEMTFHMETEKSGVLTVQALDMVDVPIAGAKIFVFEAIVDGIVPGDGNIGVRYVPGELIMSGTAGANGRITTGVLGSGSYLVYIEANGFETAGRVVHMNGDQVVQITLSAGSSTPVDPTNPGEPVETPTPGTTPTPGETQTPGQTPTPGETPVPGNPGGGDDDDDQPGNSTTGVLSVGLALCTDAGCDTQYDGYSVTWTVTPLQTAATDEIDAAKMAAVGMTSAPVSLAAMQQAQSFSITAVIQDGMAVGTSGELQIGSYNVCLNPVITGPNGETATIADGAICSDVDVTSAGNILLPFTGVAGAIDAGGPTEVPSEGGSGEPTSPSVPGEEGTAQSGGDTATDTSASAGSVDKLPNTGTGSQSGQSHGFMVVTLLVLLIGTSAIGRKRFHRA